MSEETMAALVVDWLHEQRWEVYQEVTMGGPRADIVATQGPLLWVIECKQSRSLSVMAQAWDWRGHAHYVSVASPPGRRGDTGAFANMVLRDYGIGALEVQGSVREVVAPRLWRRADIAKLRGRLREEHKTYAPAGNARGLWYSPWKATCDEVRRFVEAHGPSPLKAVIEGIRHHYRTSATARSSLAKWIEQGSIDGVRLVRDGKLISVSLDLAADRGRG